MKRIGVVLVALGAATLSCQVIMGLHDPQGNDAATPDAQTDTGASDDPCHHAGPPPPPAKDDDTETKKTFWFATQSITLPLGPDAGVQPGFDLDNACTCSADKFDGAAPCRSPAGPPAFCDYDGGVDDGFGASIIGSHVNQYVDVSKPANGSLRSGGRTLLLYLTDYNDKANDSDVSVQFIDSGGLYTPLDCDGNDAGNPITFADPSLLDPPLPAQRRAPLNRGCDRWSPNQATTTGTFPNRKPFQTLGAYVTNYTVVVRFKDLSANVFGGASTISDGISIATLSKDENGIHHATGIFSGRIPFDGLVDLVARTPVDDGAQDGGQIPFCDSPLYSLVNGFACKAVDTMSSPSEDFKDQTCDATTLQFGFQLVEAQVDDVEFTNALQGINCSNPPPKCN